MASHKNKYFRLKRDPSEFSIEQLKRVKGYVNGRVTYFLLNNEMDSYLDAITIVNKINNELKKRVKNEISEIDETTKQKKI